MDKLLPCPFCGTQPKFKWSFGSYLCECPTCGASKSATGLPPPDCIYSDEREQWFQASATANWNRRAAPQVKQAGEPVAWMNADGFVSKQSGGGYDTPLYDVRFDR